MVLKIGVSENLNKLLHEIETDKPNTIKQKCPSDATNDNQSYRERHTYDPHLLKYLNT